MSEPDEARDPHLRAALRHAPDAQVQAPPQLSELILKEARAKARGASPAATPAPTWARRAWDWLARPAVATGFAGVMAATLVGLLWWDQPMDEAMPRAPAPAEAPRLEKPAAAEAPILERGQPAAAPKPAPEPARKKADAPRQKLVERDTREAAAGATATADAARPAPPPAPAPMAAAPPADIRTDTRPEAPLAKARVQEEEQKRERSSTAPAEAPSRRAAATATAQLNESRLQREGEAFTRVASVRAAIAAEPTRWAWQRASGSVQPMSDAVYAWLAQLDGSTGNRWQAQVARETAAPHGRALALLRDGQLLHSFQLTEQGVLWQRGQTAWQVELPAETLAALQAVLDSAAP